MILNEFDKDRKGIINPEDITKKVIEMPKIAISVFSQKIIDKIVDLYNPEIITHITNANEKVPVYKIKFQDVEIAFFKSRVGAAACTVSYEEIIVKGVEKLILFGTCGVLDKNIKKLDIIIPTFAIRDEGTSYHYVEAKEEIEVNKKYIEVFKSLLELHNYSYIEGKTWTTDAPYRETKTKMERRKEQGCISVEMECSAMQAVADYRGKEIFVFFYSADNLDSKKWDKRNLGCVNDLDQKTKIAVLALEFASKIGK